jgi:hypothetical protein
MFENQIDDSGEQGTFSFRELERHLYGVLGVVGSLPEL